MITFENSLFITIGDVIPQGIPVFKEGERVVFVGNSITCGGRYHSYIWLYCITRFPDRKIIVFNEGIAVSGLSDGNYLLKIEGRDIARFPLMN